MKKNLQMLLLQLSEFFFLLKLAFPSFLNKNKKVPSLTENWTKKKQKKNDSSKEITVVYSSLNK